MKGGRRCPVHTGDRHMPTPFFDDPRLLAPPQTVKVDLGGGAFVLRVAPDVETFAPKVLVSTTPSMPAVPGQSVTATVMNTIAIM